MIIGTLDREGQIISKDGKFLCPTSDPDASVEWQDTAEHAIMYIPTLPSIETLKQNFNVDMTGAKLIRINKRTITTIV